MLQTPAVLKTTTSALGDSAVKCGPSTKNYLENSSNFWSQPKKNVVCSFAQAVGAINFGVKVWV